MGAMRRGDIVFNLAQIGAPKVPGQRCLYRSHLGLAGHRATSDVDPECRLGHAVDVGRVLLREGERLEGV